MGELWDTEGVAIALQSVLRKATGENGVGWLFLHSSTAWLCALELIKPCIFLLFSYIMLCDSPVSRNVCAAHQKPSISLFSVKFVILWDDSGSPARTGVFLGLFLCLCALGLMFDGIVGSFMFKYNFQCSSTCCGCLFWSKCCFKNVQRWLGGDNYSNISCKHILLCQPPSLPGKPNSYWALVALNWMSRNTL